MLHLEFLINDKIEKGGVNLSPVQFTLHCQARSMLFLIRLTTVSLGGAPPVQEALA